MLHDITLGDIAEAIAFIVAFIGGVGFIYRKIKKWLRILFEEQLKKIEEEIGALSSRMEEADKSLAARVEKSDMEGCKNFLVRCLTDVERGTGMSEIEKERFYEQYDHYKAAGGNSYIREKVESLKHAGKL